MKAHKLDIFDVMAAVDKRDREFLDRQEPETKKGFAPPVALRWASTVTGPQAFDYLVAVNEFANPHFHDLYEYPDLQFRLLTLAGCGKPQRHQWIPITKQGRSSTRLQNFIARFSPLASTAELDLILSMHDCDTFRDLVMDSGCAPDEAKDLISDFNKNAEPKKAKR